MNILNKNFQNIMNNAASSNMTATPNAALPPQMLKNIQQLKQMRAMCNGNVSSMVQQMGQSNPQIAQVLQMCKNGNPEQLFYQLCQQQGVNPKAVIEALRN